MTTTYRTASDVTTMIAESEHRAELRRALDEVHEHFVMLRKRFEVSSLPSHQYESMFNKLLERQDSLLSRLERYERPIVRVGWWGRLLSWMRRVHPR